MPLEPSPYQPDLARIFRAESGRILALLISQCGGDIQMAEDALQDACAQATVQWQGTAPTDRQAPAIATACSRC